jgi:hypothetical protein
MLTVFPADARAILEEQLAQIALVQRFADDKMVTIHFLDRQAQLPLLSNRSDECRAVRMQVRSQMDHHCSMAADVVFHGGRISSIEYSKPPTCLLEGAVVFESIEILKDALHPETRPEAHSLKRSLLDRVRDQFPVRDVLAPASVDQTSKFLALLGRVPTDYAGLLRETDGFAVKDWQFYGTNARRLPSHGGIWLVAEASDSALCLREASEEPLVFYFDEIDDELAVKGTSFVDAFLHALSGKSGTANERG